MNKEKYTKEEYIYYMFFRFLKEKALYHEFFTYCEISKSSKEEILQFLCKLINSTNGERYAQNIISNAFIWCESEKYFKSDTSWTISNIEWQSLSDYIYYGKDSNSTKYLKEIYGI